MFIKTKYLFINKNKFLNFINGIKIFKHFALNKKIKEINIFIYMVGFCPTKI